MADKKRFDIILKNSICTDNPIGTDIWPFGAQEATHNQNTGIERQGGITNVYEQETTFATAGADSIITKSGDLLQVDSSHNVRLNDTIIGNVGKCTVYNRGALPQYLDAVWTFTGTILGLKRKGTTLTVDEYDPITATITNTRDITFAGFPTSVLLLISFVRYWHMAYADSQEFLGVFNDTHPSRLLVESGTTVNDMAATSITTRFDNAYRFEAGKYIIGRQGIASSWYHGDITTTLTNITPSQWVLFDEYATSGKTRALQTFIPQQQGAIITGINQIGHVDGGAWTTTPTYYGPNLGGATPTVSNPIMAPGYYECSYTTTGTGTTIFSLTLPYNTSFSSYNEKETTNSATPVNAFSVLNTIHSVLAPNDYGGCQLRLCMTPTPTGGAASFLSAAPLTMNYDPALGNAELPALGVPITNVGEVDPYFLMHVSENVGTYTFTRIIYRFNAILYFIDIRVNAGHTINKVSDNLYQINCISPFNVVDVKNKVLVLGANDYNGRFIVKGGSITATHKMAVRIRSPYGASVDVGDKLMTNTTTTGARIVGIALPTFVDRAVNLKLDAYLDDVYETSYTGFSVQSVDHSMDNTVYVVDTNLPTGMGYLFGERIVRTEAETIFLGVSTLGNPDVDYDYVGYQIGNQTPGVFYSFLLFGQTYLFDGNRIYLSAFDRAIFQGRGQPICQAYGMVFIAVSPTAAYFLSAFDNSLYIFDGGRSLQKWKRMNDEPTITDGVYNVRDETLALQTATSFIWIRDGIVTENLKKANQTLTVLYDTSAGVVIANATKKWTYSFLDPGSSTVVPLTFQSSYFGAKTNLLSIGMSFVVTLYSPSKAAATVTLNCYSFDQDGYATQTEYLKINPADWNTLGLFRARIQPKTERALAASVGVSCSTKIVVTDICMEYQSDAAAVIASAGSK